MKKKSQKGSTLLEILVVTAILSSVSLAFLGTFAVLSKFHEKNLRIMKADLLAEEGMEALRIIKSQNFDTLSAIAQTGDLAPHYLEVSTSTWSVTTTPEVVEGLYYRYFVIKPAQRTATFDLVTTPGNGDPVDLNTIFLDVHVEWQWRNATNTNIYKAFMTNI